MQWAINQCSYVTMFYDAKLHMELHVVPESGGIVNAQDLALHEIASLF